MEAHHVFSKGKALALDRVGQNGSGAPGFLAGSLERGANLVKRLGIRCIWMPIVSIVIASVIAACLGAELGDVSNLPGVVTGIVLILASLIFRYGAELEAELGRRGRKADELGESL